MLGVYDFCGHYEWTFEWLHRRGGDALVHQYWDEAIHRDSQRHAAELIVVEGIEGMKKYFGHSLTQEEAGYKFTATEKVFRLDMHACPSKGFLLQNNLEQYPDYCDHCMGWIGPLAKRAGFVIDHEHNHCGQCWWEYRKAADPTPPSEPGALSGEHDVRHRKDWKTPETVTDHFTRATDPDDKNRTNGQNPK